jgi:hypothetical protein
VLVWSRRRVWWVLSFFVELSSGLCPFIGGSRLSDLTCFVWLGSLCFAIPLCVFIFDCNFNFLSFFSIPCTIKGLCRECSINCGPANSLHCEIDPIFYIESLPALFEFNLFTDRSEQYHTIAIHSGVSQIQVSVSSPRSNMPIPGAPRSSHPDSFQWMI